LTRLTFLLSLIFLPKLELEPFETKFGDLDIPLHADAAADGDSLGVAVETPV